MIQQSLQESIDLCYEICDAMTQAGMARSSALPLRELLRTEFVKFMAFLSSADGAVSPEELSFIGETTGMSMTMQQLESYKRVQHIDSTLFVKEPPKAVKFFVLADAAHKLNTKPVKGNVSDQLMKTYQELGLGFIACNEIKTDREIRLLTDYIKMLEDFMKEYGIYPIHTAKDLKAGAKAEEKPEEKPRVEDLLVELNSMVGLDGVKRVIEESVSFYKLQKTYRERGICLKTPARSMVFTGNPGTAKTTVARLTAKVFKDNGLIESGNIVEVGRADLVGKFVGWTAPTVKAAFQRAKGSILFIDEAYLLGSGSEGSIYEAVGVLLDVLENKREDILVILAGYEKDMSRFLDLNQGLASRLPERIRFGDYNERELLEIFIRLCDENGFSVSEEALEMVKGVIREEIKSQNFANARSVRKIFETVYRQHAVNMIERGLLPENGDEEFAAADVVCEDIEEHLKIGFC